MTGASSGIGEATALELAGLGARVAIAARRVDRLEALAERIRFTGGDVLVIHADFANELEANSSVWQTKEHFGRLDILINNAGVMLLGPILNADTEDWRRMFDVNVMGLMYATHAALPIMIEQGEGHIVNISSVAGRFTGPPSAVYSATKFAVNAFSEGLRKQVSKKAIRVTVIEPGAVATELQSHITHEQTRADIQDWIAGMEPLQSEDIAAAISYAVTQHPRVNVNEILIRPTQQDT